MKRKLSLLMAIISIIILLVLPAYAGGGTFWIEEFGLSVTIPSNYEGFSRRLEGNDEFLDYYGANRELLIQFIEDNDVFFLAFHEDLNDEILITRTAATSLDLNTMSEEVINALKASLVSELVNAGCEVISEEIYKGSEIVLIKTTFSIDDGDEISYRQMYSSYSHGVQLNLRLTSYLGYISDEQESTLKAIADSLSFTDTASGYVEEAEPEKEIIPSVSSPFEEKKFEESLMPAISSPPWEMEEQGFASTALGVFVAFIIAVLPIAIYRFIIKKSAVDKKTAGRIAVFYGIFAFIASYAVAARMPSAKLIVSSTVVLWSVLNFVMLIIGKVNAAQQVNAARTYEPDVPKSPSFQREDFSRTSPVYESPQYEEKQPETVNYVADRQPENFTYTEERQPEVFNVAEEKPAPTFCTNCGSKLRENSYFCNECGAAIVRK